MRLCYVCMFFSQNAYRQQLLSTNLGASCSLSVSGKETLEAPGKLKHSVASSLKLKSLLEGGFIELGAGVKRSLQRCKDTKRQFRKSRSKCSASGKKREGEEGQGERKFIL